MTRKVLYKRSAFIMYTEMSGHTQLLAEHLFYLQIWDPPTMYETETVACLSESFSVFFVSRFHNELNSSAL